MTVHRTASPMDRWLACNPGKTPADWGELIKRGNARAELAALDGRVYMTDADRRRRTRERQQLSRARAKRRQEKLEAENAKLRELVRDMALNMGGCALHGNPLRLREFISRARKLGIEVDDGAK